VFAPFSGKHTYDTALSSQVKCIKAIDTILFWSSGIIKKKLSIPVSPDCFSFFKPFAVLFTKVTDCDKCL